MKPGRYKYHFAEVPLYGSGLHVIIAEDLAAGYSAAGFSDTDGRDMNSYGAFAWQQTTEQGHAVFALFRPGAGAGLVCHESLHLTNYLFKRKGIKPDLDNDEPQAYLLAWIVDEVNYALTSKQVKPRKTINLL